MIKNSIYLLLEKISFINVQTINTIINISGIQTILVDIVVLLLPLKVLYA